ncbi:MAG: hypothetical protein LC650_03970 [Actinobacteria bacterium]|nr:hypothetical protein [Actinomycetota bacterium]
MRGADLRARYEWTVAWNDNTLLDLIIQHLEREGMLDEVVANLDATAEEEMEMYAAFGEG